MRIVNPNDLNVGDVILYWSRESRLEEKYKDKCYDYVPFFQEGTLYKVYKLDILSEGHVAYGIAIKNPLMKSLDGNKRIGTVWWGTFIYPESPNQTIKNPIMMIKINDFINKGEKERGYLLTKIYNCLYNVTNETLLESFVTQYKTKYGYNPITQYT